MEPMLDTVNQNKAPIVVWSNGSASLSDLSLAEKTKNNANNTSKSVSIALSLDDFSHQKYNNNNNNYSKEIISNGVSENGPLEDVKFLNSDGKVLRISSNDSICSTSTAYNEPKKSKVPDGGWGWVVVFSSFVISMIADGISFSFGLLYIEFLNYFQESKSKTSWIGSLFMSVPLLSGPIMSALVDRYGCRKMTMLGGLISALGFVLASIGDTIEWEFIFFGFVAGMGLGLCYVTAVVSVAYWFDKYRSLAIGLASCGTGVGTFIYAPLTQYLNEEFGWRGTVLILAGTFLNMCVCGAVMRDPRWLTLEQMKQSSVKSLKNESSCGSVSGTDFPKKEEIKKWLKKGESPEYILTALVTTIDKCTSLGDNEKEKGLPSVRSVVNLPTFMKQNEKVPLEVLEQLANNKTLYHIILENYPSLLHSRSLSDDKNLNQLSKEGKPIPVTMSMKLKRLRKQDANEYFNGGIPFMEEPGRKGPFFSDREINLPENHFSNNGKEVASDQAINRKNTPRPVWCRETGQHYYLRDIRLHRNSVMYRGAMMNIPRYRLRASSCPNIFRNSMTTLAKENEEKWYADALELLKTMFDFSMFVELHFLFMSLATILLFTWFIVPYFYLAEHLTRHGYSEVEGSFLLSIIGVANCIGMVGLGWAGDQPWMNVTKTYAACLALCGLSSILMPLLTDNYNFLAVVSALFGLFFAGNYSFTPSILVQLIPLERFTTAYGLTLLCQGIGNLVGPPLAGWIFDVTGEWDLTFYMAGTWIIVSAVLIILIQHTKNRRLLGSGTLEMDKVVND